jgi:type I restriction enzyme S subunit
LHNRLPVGIAMRDVAFNQDVKSLVADPKILSSWYLLYWLVGNERYLLDSIVEETGIGAGKLDTKRMQSLPIRIPSISTQNQIVKVFKSIDDKIELNRQTNQTLEQIAQALFKSWFVDFEPTRAKIAAKEAGASREEIERAAMCAISGKTPDQLAQLPPETQQNLKTTAALFPDALVDSELGEIPAGWKIGGLKDCCIRVESGGTPSRSESSYWNGGIKWLSSGEVRDVIALDTKETISFKGLENSSAKLWPIGTTVVAMYGATAGQVCILANEMSANQACCALIPKSISRCYLFLIARLSIDQLLGKASGSAQQNLNKSLVADHRILLPSDSIMEVFENSVTSLIGTWIKNTEQNLVLAETRDSLLPKLLSGEISITESLTDLQGAA